MAILIDSNIIIYSFFDEFKYLRELIINSYISEISRVEVLGYHRLKEDEEKYFNDLFSLVNVIVPSREIFDKAIELRKKYHMKLGDSIIASTSLINDFDLYTSNTEDFKKVIGLRSFNAIP